jgi:hypothetical protein
MHSLRVEVSDLSACRGDAQLSLDSKDLSLDCEVLALRQGQDCSQNPMLGSLLLEANGDILLIQSVNRVDVATLTIDGGAACDASIEFTPKHEKDGEPNGPGCGFRYRGTATVNLTK